MQLLSNGLQIMNNEYSRDIIRNILILLDKCELIDSKITILSLI
jgi:hypothetical protein